MTFLKWCSGKLALVTVLLFCVHGVAQQSDTPIPQGGSIPGVSAVPMNLNGPGYVEVGGGYSGLTKGFEPWRDFYLNSALSHNEDAFGLEVTRQNRYGGTGWYGAGSWTRTWNADWFTSVDAGTSAGGFFIPKVRVDAFLNRKLLKRKQLVVEGGMGYDKSKIQNHAVRAQAGAMYYFGHPFMVQGGVTWTWASPGGILTHSQSFAVIQGREKEHYFTVSTEFGHEGYELIGPQTSLFDFGFHKYSAGWRQWIGTDWGFNMTYDYESNFAFHRNGGTFGIFMDF